LKETNLIYRFVDRTREGTLNEAVNVEKVDNLL